MMEHRLRYRALQTPAKDCIPMIICSKKPLMQQHPVLQRQQISLTLFIAWSLFFVVICSSCGTAPTQTGQNSSISCSSHSSQPVTLTMAYSSEKQVWIEDVVKDFNSQHMTACD